VKKTELLKRIEKLEKEIAEQKEREETRNRDISGAGYSPFVITPKPQVKRDGEKID
jgi:uncharacterized protein with von Willebrand factor type A (vWA) domain